MKRSTKLALSLVLGLGLVAPAFAQDNFPDVPANHWAYEALARMKRDGLLVGYPDGLYRGGRPASRYELAVAMHAVYTNLKNITDGLDAQIRSMGTGGNYASQADVQALKDSIAQLQSDLAAMKGYGDDIAALKRAAETFDRELKSLGVDVEAMKKDLGDLAGRVSALEKKKPSIEVSGDVNLLVLATNSTGAFPGISQDGRTLGLNNNGDPAGLTDTLGVFHEAAFTVASTNVEGVKFKGTGVIGNMISDGLDTIGGDSLGSQSNLPTGRYSDSITSDVYLQNLEAMFGATALGIGFDVRLGRVQHKVSPYLFQRIDNTSYYSNERWDNGEYSLDGGVLAFKKFGAAIKAFGGRTSERYSVNGVDINQVILGNNRVAGGGLLASSDEDVNNPGSASNFDVDRVLGVQLATPLTKIGNLNLAYLWLDGDNVGATDDLNGIAGANRLEVYGGDADFTFGRFKIGGGYSESQLNNNSSPLDAYNDENSAFRAKVAFQGNRFNLYGVFQEIEANYIAPGDWGRLGILRNPGNVRGFTFGGSLNISDALVLSGTGASMSGLSVDGGTSLIAPQYFNNETGISSFAARVDFKVNPNMSLYGSYEDTRFRDLAVGSGNAAKYRFSTVGIAYGLSSNAKLNLAYQYSDVKNEAFLAGATGTGRNKGGILSTQLTVKF